MSVTEFHSLPVDARPSQPWPRALKAALFFVLFNSGCLFINVSQFAFLLPLRLLPFRFARPLYQHGIRCTKGAFGCLLILMCQWFAPTKLRITFETQGKGKFTQEEISQVVQRDKNGKVASLNLPNKFILTSNHQIYADWWYMWCLMYFLGPRGVHRHVYITLKKSLQWVPIVGWGMQFFNFIFLARSWASDRHILASRLAELGKNTEKEDNPLCYILYPEGTLVSRNTRPLSKQYADKTGISDMTNILLPRSLGLHYSLRSLAPRIPDLRLLDITVVYPGIPPLHYGQDYYTLRSIFFDGVAPPMIHMHLRLFNVATDVPIASHSKAVPNGSAGDHLVEVDIPPSEKSIFDNWLRELWQEKDEFISKSLSTGHTRHQFVDIPLELRSKREYLDAFCFFIPVACAYIWKWAAKRA